MPDVIVNVTPQSTASVGIEVDNVASYYYDLAKQWAISTDLVEQLDYSSKYYANLSSTSATTSQNAADSILNNAGFIAVSADLTNIDTVAGSISNVNAVATDISNVNAVYADLSNIDSVVGDLTNIDTVSGSISNVNSVAGDLTNINAVANDLTDIGTVASNITDVNTCSVNISDINICADNIAVITNKANISLDNLNATGKARIAVKQYLITETYNTDDIVIAIVDSQVSMYKSLVNNNTGNSLTDTTKWEVINLGGSSRNIGEIVTSTMPLIDAGLHLLDGSLILGGGIYNDFVSYIADLTIDYPDLFETEANWQTSVTTYGVCGKFVYDSANNTVRLPKITGIIEGTTDLTALGDLVQAGLPNITGTLQQGNANVGKGSLISTAGGTGSSGYLYNRSSEAQNNSYPVFDASLANSIYGNSNTVQPQTIKTLFYICIATAAKTSIEVDIDEVVTDLASKVDKTGDTMTGDLTINKATPLYILKNTDLDKTSTTAPSDNIASAFQVQDKNGNYISNLLTMHDTSNNFYQSLDISRTVNGSTNNAAFGIFLNTQNQDFAYATAGVKASITNWSFPSSRYDELALGASGASYIAPADGYAYLWGYQSDYNGYIFLMNDANGMEMVSPPTNVNNFAVRVFVPVGKGDPYKITYGAVHIEGFKFIYAKGEA